ncbi:MAG: hemolysin family protein, partial [Acidimicrobiia bacterium]
LNAILLAALLAQIGAATVVGVLAQRWFGNLGITLASIALTLLLFVYGEAIPKTYAVQHPDRVALRMGRPIGVLERLLRPIVSGLVWIADLQLPGKGITTPTVTEDELRRLASHAAVEGEITEDDRTLIERAFRFGDQRADDIMVPRPDIVAVAAGTSTDEALDVAVATGHRRLPVFEGTIENITGVIKLRELVRARDEGVESVDEIADPPLVVPESKRVIDLLEDMQRSGKHMAVVVDEYGGTAGLVTVEDVAEELLGTISEEGEAPQVIPVGENHWIISAALPASDFADLIGAELPEGDYMTVAGLMMSEAGEVLQIGDAVHVCGRRLVVAAARRRRITQVEILPPS